MNEHPILFSQSPECAIRAAKKKPCEKCAALEKKFANAQSEIDSNTEAWARIIGDHVQLISDEIGRPITIAEAFAHYEEISRRARETRRSIHKIAEHVRKARAEVDAGRGNGIPAMEAFDAAQKEIEGAVK